MKKLFFLSVFLLSLLLCLDIQTTTAQELDWVRTAGSIYKNGSMIARDANDNVVSCAYTINDRIYIRKWDQFGNFQWEKESTSGVMNNFEQSSWITTDASDNIITLGYRYTFSSSSQFPNAIVILKYTPAGALLFKQTIPGVVGPARALRCELDPSGNIFIGTGGLITGQSQAGFNLIKLDPNGNILWTSVHNFGSVHGVYNMRYRNGYIALTGTTTFNGFNCTTALFDANGNYLWGITTTSLTGQDVEVDNAGNVYVVNTDYASGLDQDIKVTKYSVTGTVLFTYFYDNNSHYETPSRINIHPDGNFVITGVSNTPSTSTGIETFKLSSSGSLMWDAFYGTPFPDIPQVNFLATNSENGDIFITGTTSISGNPASIITIKYDPLGNESWVEMYDSTATRGMGLAIASDGSVFVVGLTWWTVLHYLNTSSGGTCGIPTNVTVSGINNDGATISWNAIAGALTYHVQYKTSASSLWIQVSTDQTTLALSGLFQGTTYDFGIEAVCNGGTSGFSTTQQFTTTGIPYCTSMGLNASNDRINFVWLGGIMNQTLDIDGYADYTSLTTDLLKGSTNTITLSAILGGNYKQTWRIWIDFNQDGDFLDNGERCVSFKSGNFGWNITTLKVPNNASLGSTRMRVSLKKGGPAQTPCEIFARGEVEDYSVNILPARIGSSFGSDNGEAPTPLQLIVYPNPATNFFHVDLKGFEGKVTIQVFDLTGKLMQAQITDAGSQSQLDIHSLVQGLYLLRVTDGNGKTATTKWIKD